MNDNAVPDPVGSGAQLLAEVIYAVEQLAPSPPHTRRSTTLRDLRPMRFFESSLVLYDRCLRIAISDDDRQSAYANLTAAYWAARRRARSRQAQPPPS
jgi:hypothetical protein